jgi:hypothetical protein
LRHAPRGHRLRQPGAKQIGPKALVQFIRHLVTMITNVDKVLPIFQIPCRSIKW